MNWRDFVFVNVVILLAAIGLGIVVSFSFPLNDSPAEVVGAP